jgi:hypothetical protein
MLEEKQMAKDSALEKYTKLKAEADKYLADAKAEVRARVDAAIAQLNELDGGNYRLANGAEPAKGKKVQRQVKDAECKVCGFKTSPLHDGRRHKGQETAKPFTAAELKEMGLEKV